MGVRLRTSSRGKHELIAWKIIEQNVAFRFSPRLLRSNTSFEFETSTVCFGPLAAIQRDTRRHKKARHKIGLSVFWQRGRVYRKTRNRSSAFGLEQSVWQELLDSLPDNINYVNGPVLSYCQIVSDLKLTVIVAKSAEYSLRLAS